MPRVASCKDRLTRESRFYDEFEAVIPQELIVLLAKLFRFRRIRANDRVNGFAQETQEDLIVRVQEVESVIVENPVLIPV